MAIRFDPATGEFIEVDDVAYGYGDKWSPYGQEPYGSRSPYGMGEATWLDKIQQGASSYNQFANDQFRNPALSPTGEPLSLPEKPYLSPTGTPLSLPEKPYLSPTDPPPLSPSRDPYAAYMSRLTGAKEGYRSALGDTPPSSTFTPPTDFTSPTDYRAALDVPSREALNRRSIFGNRKQTQAKYDTVASLIGK